MSLSKDDQDVLTDIKHNAKKASLHLRDYGQKSLADAILYQVDYIVKLTTKLAKGGTHASTSSKSTNVV